MNKLHNTVGLFAPYRSRCSEPLLNIIFASRTSAPTILPGGLQRFPLHTQHIQFVRQFQHSCGGGAERAGVAGSINNSNTLAARVLDGPSKIPALLRRGCRTSGRPGRPSTSDATSLPSPSGGWDERASPGAVHKRRYESALPIGGAGRAALHRVPGFPFARPALRMLTFALAERPSWFVGAVGQSPGPQSDGPTGHVAGEILRTRTKFANGLYTRCVMIGGARPDSPA